jgi:hypothetical protein
VVATLTVAAGEVCLLPVRVASPPTRSESEAGATTRPSAPWRKRTSSRLIAFGSRTTRILEPLPKTVSWPPSVRGCGSRHVSAAISETSRPA